MHDHAHDHDHERQPGENIKWYRCQVSKEDLAELNKRSDFLGFVQTLGFLGILALTGVAAFYSASHWPWYVTVLLTYVHGASWHFLINGFHELIHDSVFKTRGLNRFFLWVFSWLGQYNHIAFWASHTEHHKYTLHPPDDLEVVLPQTYTVKGFLKGAFVNLWGPWWTLKYNLRLCAGRLEGKWEHHLFDDNPRERAKLFNWGRFLLASHVALAAVSLYFGYWMVPILVTLAPHYAGGLHFLCNSAQHVGLRDNVPDFRLCCRTIYLNPVFQFLYWHMNYHTEHHMYAAVPCYKLPRLHRLIKKEMPHCPNGLYQTWKEIGAILKRQKEEPGYQFTAELPPRPAPFKAEAPKERASAPAVGEPVLN
ncbi:MAG: fatty acid desaturase [Planctomycetota bacterium]|nr:fatty acid desaturase [Planctomycetota bacterium]